MDSQVVQVITSIIIYLIMAFGSYMMGRQSEQKIWSGRMFELWRKEIQAIKDKIDLQTVHGEKYEPQK